MPLSGSVLSSESISLNCLFLPGSDLYLNLQSVIHKRKMIIVLISEGSQRIL